MEQLIAKGMIPNDAQTLAEREVKQLLKHRREARKLQERLEERLKELIPIYVCDFCHRPWGTGQGQCTYMGPIIVGYEEAPRGSKQRS